MRVASTNPGALLAERVRDAGRKGLFARGAFSVQTLSSAARGHFDPMSRTRRDASPPGSGGLYNSSGLRRLLPSWLFSCVARWRGSG
ncbi:hypothetical protein RHIZ_07765 [Rhizobium skierniewicense]|uniref:hypothetical protein n=1 Tax=Rhizobium skierniewicense TaxID=984260 RepID=UPI001FAD2E68|nr:hypothetical protein [Rhizobium skierniewicense]MCI9865835.1 hypothetical protein [Rhizobium skierniewicense]